MTQNDKITVIIHTENETKLLTLLNHLHQHPLKSQFQTLQVNCKGITPWLEPNILNKLTTLAYQNYSITPTQSQPVSSIVELISKTKTEYSLIIDESNTHFNVKDWDTLNNTYLLAQTNDLLRLNWDTNYQSITWFIADLISQKTRHKFNLDNTSDSERYFKKIDHPLFYERIIYVDGGLGDHVMAYPLLEKIESDCYICSIYPFSLEHIKCKGFISWTDELFGGYKRFVYTYGSTNNSPTIIDAFFEMYGEKREQNNILNYTGPKIKFENTTGKPLALICISAAKIGGQESNKDWPEIRWFKLIYKLKQLGYHVIQVGSYKDNQIPLSVTQTINAPYCPGGVDDKFLDKSISELAGLIDEAKLWISVDTFFHHFASSINPDAGICLTPFYNNHAKHPGVKYIEKDCGKNYHDRRWWLDSQQPERKECMNLITIENVLTKINKKYEIIYYGLGPDDNCSNWRAYMPFNRISKEINYNIINVSNDKFNIERDKHADLVIINRPVIYLLDYIKQLKSFNVKVAVDYDDMFPYVELKEPVFIQAYTEILNILQETDVVLTTNDKLKYYFEQHTKKPVKIFPNIVNPKFVSIKEKRNDDKIILGWYGSGGHLASLKLIYKDILKILDDFENVYFNLYADAQEIKDLFKHPKTNVYHYNHNFKEFQNNLNNIDINIAPLEETYINLGKSDIRIQLAAIKGIPSVATNFAAYKTFGELKGGALLTENNNWYKSLKSLVIDKEKIKELSVKAKETIDEYFNYDIWSNIKDQELINLIENGTK
jgi:hypothetical protein